MIKVNDRFSFYRDKYQWVLIDLRPSEHKWCKSGSIKEESYHSTLKQIAHVVLDRSAGECETMDSLLNFLENAQDIVTEKIEGLK